MLKIRAVREFPKGGCSHVSTALLYKRALAGSLCEYMAHFRLQMVELLCAHVEERRLGPP